MKTNYTPPLEELNLTQEQMIREIYLERKRTQWPQDVESFMVTTDELEDLTGLCRKTFERMRGRGELEAVKIGSKVRYSLIHLMQVARRGLFPKNRTMVLSEIFRKQLMSQIELAHSKGDGDG
ncbi:MAG: helix-turn-helix domain-containing protein [Muribaculum sp.]|nr:helix-turn-helix domain-containing protein [Muribaculum sp.]